jgi:hypothetical protein
MTAFKMLEGVSWDDAALSVLSVFEEKKMFFQNAFSSTDINGLRNYSVGLSIELLTQMLQTKGVDTADPEILFLLDVYVRGCANVTVIWIMGGMNVSKEQIAKLLKRSWPAELADYIN